MAYPDRRGTLPVEQLLEIKFRGVEVEEGVHFYERNTSKLYVRELKPSQLIFAEGFAARPGTRRLKRILDVGVSVIGLVLAAPLMLLTAFAIRLESPGPTLYSQVRAGEFGKLFTIYKFRSMRTDAEKAGAQFAQENDPRVTRVGKFIRKTRLDELPQLWNVLRGDMSMVGPRPERPVFIEQLEQQVPFFKQRLYVKPGVTGHAQVRCRYGASDGGHGREAPVRPLLHQELQPPLRPLDHARHGQGRAPPHRRALTRPARPSRSRSHRRRRRGERRQERQGVVVGEVPGDPGEGDAPEQGGYAPAPPKTDS